MNEELRPARTIKDFIDMKEIAKAGGVAFMYNGKRLKILDHRTYNNDLAVDIVALYHDPLKYKWFPITLTFDDVELSSPLRDDVLYWFWNDSTDLFAGYFDGMRLGNYSIRTVKEKKNGRYTTERMFFSEIDNMPTFKE